MNHVQMVNDNYDVIHNPKVKEKYPLLYKEVVEHDKVSTSSWYELSDAAYKEYQEYINDKSEVQFIAGYLNAERLYFSNSDTYKFTIKIEQNISNDLNLIELDEYDEDGDDFFTNILDEDDIPDDKIFGELDNLDE